MDTQIRYGRSEGNDIARKAQATLKFDLLPEETWSPFLFARTETDAVRGLDLRVQSGAGAKYTFLRDERTEASLSLGALYDREQVTAQPTATNARLSWRFKGEKSFGDGIRFQQTTFYQPFWDSPGDYLILARTGFSTRLTDHVALTISHQYDRDSTPSPEVRAVDQTVDVGLKLEF